MQGAALAAAIAERGQRVEFAGIQEHGGSRACVRDGVDVGDALLRRRSPTSRAPPSLTETVIGIEASHASPLAEAFAERARRRARRSSSATARAACRRGASPAFARGRGARCGRPS